MSMVKGGSRYKNMVICFWCNDVFYRSPGKQKSINFCSPQCSDVGRKFLSTRFATCLQCGDMFEYDAVENAYGRKFCKKECHEVYNRGEHNHLFGKRGADHPVYKEIKKVTPTGYAANFQVIAKRVNRRDGYACVKCGRQNRRLHTHHIDHDRLNDTCLNLVTLCAPCHAKETASRGDDRSAWVVELSAIAGGKKDLLCGNKGKCCKLAVKG